jgi:hypothetical protein
MTRHERRPLHTSLLYGLLILAWLMVGEPLALPPLVWLAESPFPNKTFMTCGTCPSGFVVTGVTTDKAVCKEGEPTLVECTPLGQNLLGVCGSCPEGYTEIGNSIVPAICGSIEGGRLSRCQLSKLESHFPNPTEGGLTCPPKCEGRLPMPGQGTLERPSKIMPTPEEKK